MGEEGVSGILRIVRQLRNIPRAEKGGFVELNADSVKPGIYRHFKGNIYHVLGVAENTETHELTVIYIPQEGPHAGKLCNRSVAMFLEHVEDHPERPGYRGPRFQLIVEKPLTYRYGDSTYEYPKKPDTVRREE